MLSYLLQYCKRIPPIALFIIAAIALIIKVSIDAISVLVIENTLWISPLLGLLYVVVLFAGIAIKEYWWHSQKKQHDDTSYVAEEVAVNFKLLSMAAALNVLGLVINKGISPTGFFASITNNLYAAYSFLVGAYLIAFCIRIMLNRLHKQSVSLSRLIIYTVPLFIITLFNHDFINVSYLLGFFIVSVGIYNTRRLEWIEAIPKADKIRLHWISLGSIIATAAWSFQTDTTITPFNSALSFFLKTGQPIIVIAGVWYFIMLIRFFYAVLNSLPTASLIDRKSAEVYSLASLTRIVSFNSDTQTLVHAVATLSQQTINASAMFCRVTVLDKQIESLICDESLIPMKETINDLITDDGFSDWVTTIHQATIIDTEKQILDITSNYKSEELKSILAIPIITSHRSIGILIAFHKDSYHFTPEDKRILLSIHDNLVIALENARLIQQSIHHERMEKEIQIAHQLQNKLLPIRTPDIPGYSITLVSQPAYEVGGDYFDFFTLPNGNLCILIADVSGKGITAAFSMATLKGVVLSMQLINQTSDEIIRTINTTLSDQLEKHMYITLACVIIDPIHGNVDYARAGHMPIIVTLSDVTKLLTPKGMGIGLTNSTLFSKSLESISFVLNKGDLLLLFTDGVTDSLLFEHENDGLAMLQSLVRKSNGNAKECISSIQLSLKHLGHHKQHDDVTAIAISRDIS